VTAAPNPARERELVHRLIDVGMTFGQVENAIERFDVAHLREAPVPVSFLHPCHQFEWETEHCLYHY
jgi:hypothetical protein